MSKLAHPADAYDDATIYDIALYYVITTLSTTGYGDIVAVTGYERLFAMILMIFGGGLFGYVLSQCALQPYAVCPPHCQCAQLCCCADGRCCVQDEPPRGAHE